MSLDEMMLMRLEEEEEEMMVVERTFENFFSTSLCFCEVMMTS